MNYKLKYGLKIVGCATEQKQTTMESRRERMILVGRQANHILLFYKTKTLHIDSEEED